MEDCKPCPFGHTSRAGADSAEECQKITQPCPVGQIAPPDAVSAQQCGCMPGYGGALESVGGLGCVCLLPAASQQCMVTSSNMYGRFALSVLGLCFLAGGEKATDACHICPPGTYSPGGTTQRW